jgi:uncharacterized protein (DUF4415 family)
MLRSWMARTALQSSKLGRLALIAAMVATPVVALAQGVYGSRLITLSRQSVGLDVYYLGLARDAAQFEQGTANETRHTFGARVWHQGVWAYDAEVMFQAGRFGSGDIRASRFVIEGSHLVADAVWSPRLGFVLRRREWRQESGPGRAATSAAFDSMHICAYTIGVTDGGRCRVGSPQGDRESQETRRRPVRGQPKKARYNFAGGKRGALLKTAPGKTRITIRLDDDVLEWFRKQAHAGGGGNYQTLVNAALREYVDSKHEPLEATLRRVLREELPRDLKRTASR